MSVSSICNWTDNSDRHHTDRPFKKSEAGTIPEDWEVCHIGDVMKLINGRAFKPQDWKSYGIPIIRIQNLNDPGAEFNYYQGHVDPKNSVSTGDLLFAWSGTTGTSFGARIWKGPSGVLNQHIFKVIPNASRLTTDFGLLVLQRVQEDIEKRAHGFKASFVHVRKSDLVGIALPIPTKAEQQAIATTLSDVDALIGSLDKLIAKKRAIQLATMQQLLTGKHRLQGFRTPWQRKTIGSIAPLQRGFDLPSYRVSNGPYPVVYSNGILNHHSRYMVKAPGVVTGRSGTIGKVIFVDHDFWPHNTTLWVTSFNGNDPRFVYYLYSSFGFERFATGSGVPTFNRNDAHSYEVLLPSDVEEQAAITLVLSDMEAEIASLDRRRDKTRAIKWGMMQELLTGRTHLV